MRKSILAALAVVALGVFPLVAHSSSPGYQLAASRCSVSWAPNYAGNIACSDMQATINGTPYYVSVSVHLLSDDKTFYSGLSSVTLQNLVTNEVDSYPLSGSLDNIQLGSKGGLGYADLDGTFSSGSVALHITQYYPKPCVRYCYVAYDVQANSMLTVQ
jgi:hypothetical protein